MSADGPIQLDLLDRATVRLRARTLAAAALLVGAAVGGIVGLFAGPVGFFVALAVVVLPSWLWAYGESRKTSWLHNGQIAIRTLGTRVVDLGSAETLDVLLTDSRGIRTVSLLVTGPPKGKTGSKTGTVALAMYAGTGGRELGVYALRRLADALAATGDTRALVLSELLVGQLRAEARGDAAADRPLYRLAALAPQSRIAQKLRPDDISRFVTALD